ncbi:uncharacterized protein BXZ73DRAFT_94856 [Epithele typhae]|uniref:uncharacterized protein n=1 Tax=Epithele typhae TaxID=378194 RepID=UPI0020079450|nr:uncharacterized protein BXZ73DRAFT_94856 [Epithele typhae]KAH9905069.1 hypothetical protein BXZ73DRAFT_94856 [Epithele typhae]
MRTPKVLKEAWALLRRVRWFNLAILTITPALGVYGAAHTPLRAPTLVWAAAYYVISMLGITAGYHRLWSHRSYTACAVLEYALAIMGASAVQGSCPTREAGPADIADLRKSTVVQWQHRWYFALVAVVGYALPALVAGLAWRDWRGGWVYAGLWRITFVHHSTFCINSIAHYFGDSPFDDRKTSRDHFLSAILTMGEGYHNFHHQFPMDYRNAVRWYQFDPTKWFIAACAALGLASNLRGALAMQLKRLKRLQDGLAWPGQVDDLPVLGWDAFQQEAEKRALVIVSGFIHDVEPFLDEHPEGKDATAAFCGGVYEHGNAAHNLLSMMRVGALLGGVEHVKAVSPGERLKIIERLN